MNDSRLRLTAASGLVIGAVLGIAGTFAPSASLRGLAWAASLVLVGASNTPFLAYPFLAATLFGWAWVYYRGSA